MASAFVVEKVDSSGSEKGSPERSTPPVPQDALKLNLKQDTLGFEKHKSMQKRNSIHITSPHSR